MRKLAFEEICLYCKSYDMKKRECRGRACAPTEKPDEKKCRSFRMSDDASFCFGDSGINDKLPTAWSDFKRTKLMEMYRNILRGA